MAIPGATVGGRAASKMGVLPSLKSTSFRSHLAILPAFHLAIRFVTRARSPAAHSLCSSGRRRSAAKMPAFAPFVFFFFGRRREPAFGSRLIMAGLRYSGVFSTAPSCGCSMPGTTTVLGPPAASAMRCPASRCLGWVNGIGPPRGVRVRTRTAHYMLAQ